MVELFHDKSLNACRSSGGTVHDKLYMTGTLQAHSSLSTRWKHASCKLLKFTFAYDLCIKMF